MTKTEFTALIIKDANLDITFKLAYDTWWWFNDSKDNTFRLTHQGYKALEKINKFYKFESNNMPNGVFYNAMKKVPCAYYLKLTSKVLTVYISSSKIATIITLYDGIDNYLDTLK